MKRLALTALLLGPFVVSAAHAQSNLDAMEDISIENLSNVVTSVTKNPQDPFKSAAAIYVVTQDDIKLSGATHIAEVLRSVPGLQVARVDSSNWAISSRGFNDGFANKLLVVVDGRTIYTPLFSGVYWDIQNIVLDDIERIEVIRGPGASLWGANAVNGIINIITKNAADTQGSYVSTLIGNEDRLITEARQGGSVRDNLFYRFSAKYENRDSSRTAGDTDGGNDWDNGKASFRVDYEPQANRKITMQGDIYDADIDLNLQIPSLATADGFFFRNDKINSMGTNLMTKWQERHSETLQSTFQFYYDYQSPDYSEFDQDIHTLDLDYQTNWQMNDWHEFTWGLGYRYIMDDMDGTDSVRFTKEHFDQQLYSAFVQDQISLIPKTLVLTVGTKLEHNRYTGAEIQPSGRLAWYPDEKQTIWTSASRAVRTPSRAEFHTDYDVLADPSGVMLAVISNPNLKSEEVYSYEVGYRYKPLPEFMVDVSGFINEYDDLRTYEPGDVVLDPVKPFVPFMYQNLGEGQSYGIEVSTRWDVTRDWNLLLNYSYINVEINKKPGSFDITLDAEDGKEPHHQVMLRSHNFLSSEWQLVNALYFVDELPAYAIDSYVRYDSQLIFKPAPGLEFSLVGQNLLDNSHPEFTAPLHGQANEIERAYYGKMTVRF